MFSSNKILSIIFILFFLVLIGEVVYFITIGNQLGLSVKPTPSESTSQRPKDSLVSQEILNFIGALKRSPNQKFHLKTETSGFVAGIDETTDKKAYILKIVDSQGKKIMNYVLDKQIENDRAFYLVEADKKTKITINDLKTDDKIIVDDEHEVRDNIINISFLIYR